MQGTRNRFQRIVKNMRHRIFFIYNLQPTTYNLRSQRGFTLLLAALVASIVLMLGSSIFTIARKQVALSSIGRDSQFAFYAADTGAECALYYDVRLHAFGTATDPEIASVECDKNASGGDTTALTTISGSATSKFSMDLFAWNIADGKVNLTKNCVEVTVTKNLSAPFTVIHSDGYSVSCDDINTSGRALQRSVELRY